MVMESRSALGKLCLLAGNPGQGKSLVAAMVSVTAVETGQLRISLTNGIGHIPLQKMMMQIPSNQDFLLMVLI